jgi:hypothetical protein
MLCFFAIFWLHEVFLRYVLKKEMRKNAYKEKEKDELRKYRYFCNTLYKAIFLKVWRIVTFKSTK